LHKGNKYRIQPLIKDNYSVLATSPKFDFPKRHLLVSDLSLTKSGRVGLLAAVRLSLGGLHDATGAGGALRQDSPAPVPLFGERPGRQN
jgi:hypothetical protein